MKIIRPYAKIQTKDLYPADSMRQIEWCSRISHRSEEAQSPDSWKRFIEEVVLKHGDWSVVEHISVTVDAVVDRGITHEWVRHRLFSFTQESTRFVNYTKEKNGKIKNPPLFIYPNPEVDCRACFEGYEPKRIDVHDDHWTHEDVDGLILPCEYDETWLAGISHAEIVYKGLLSKGWRPQEARSVFPNALASRLITTGNLRNWRHFFIMRTTAEAHPQMRQVTIPLLAEFKTAFPLLFDDIEPMTKQSESMRRIR
jgi:thymidylate synthase (FAD)